MDETGSAGGLLACAAPRLFDGERVLAGHAVLVQQEKVTAVVPFRQVPTAARWLREPDCTLLPGLIDTHVHFMRWQGPAFLAWGVTTVRDTGNDLGWILERRAEWQAHPWPRILCAGPLLDGPRPVHELVCRRCADAADARAAVRQTAAAGVDTIKLYVGLDPAWLPAMAAESHAAGRRVSMHCAAGGVLAAGRAGIDEFFHLDGILADVWPGHPPGWLSLWGMPEFAATHERQQEVADTIRALGLTATPTLAYWESQWRLRIPQPLAPEARQLIPRALYDWQAVPADPDAAAQWRRALERAQAFVGLLWQRGVPVLAGSDVPCGPVPPGLSLWSEMALLAEARLPPLEALRAATSRAADFLGRPELGRLAPGAAADMVFVRGDPAERIPLRPEVVRVLRGGRPYAPAELLATHPAGRWPPEAEPWGRQLARHWRRRGAGG